MCTTNAIGANVMGAFIVYYNGSIHCLLLWEHSLFTTNVIGTTPQPQTAAQLEPFRQPQALLHTPRPRAAPYTKRSNTGSIRYGLYRMCSL